MPEIKHRNAELSPNNHERKENGPNTLNRRHKIIIARENLHIPSRTASPILDADGLQIERHTIRAKPQPLIILA